MTFARKKEGKKRIIYRITNDFLLLSDLDRKDKKFCHEIRNVNSFLITRNEFPR